MSQEENNKAEDELSSWKKEREERQRKRRKLQQQEDQDVDEFADLARDLENDNVQNNGMKKNDDEDDDDEYDVPFIPLSKRKQQEKEAIIKGMAHRRRQLGMADNNNTDGMSGTAESNNRKNNGDGGDENINDQDNDDQDDENADSKKVESLLESATALHDALTEEERAEQQRKEEETRILKEASKVQTNALQAASELASGVQYTDSLPSTWSCPRYIIEQGEEQWSKTRDEWHMEVEGVDIPPPMKRFEDMRYVQTIKC
ncbi:MAG: ATP-dependent RNA helicase DDX41 [Bacillariaceae sp.]|jgi:ATP-dependent RNA helicase DDX41